VKLELEHGMIRVLERVVALPRPMLVVKAPTFPGVRPNIRLRTSWWGMIPIGCLAKEKGPRVPYSTRIKKKTHSGNLSLSFFFLLSSVRGRLETLLYSSIFFALLFLRGFFPYLTFKLLPFCFFLSFFPLSPASMTCCVRVQ